MKGIWRLSQNLYIYICCHFNRKINRIIDCLAKKKVWVILIQIFGDRIFLEMLENMSLKMIVECTLIVCVIFLIP